MIINVNQCDIDEGDKGSINNCPIARAIKRTMHVSEDTLRVDDTAIEIEGELYSSPPLAFNFIRNFDAGNSVEPFSFELKPYDYDEDDDGHGSLEIY